MCDRIIIRKRGGIFMYPVKDIVYMEKELRKIRLYTRTGEIEFYGKFDQIAPFLDKRFMYCHRSYIINMDAIVWMKSGEIYLVTNTGIHMGRDCYGKARKLFVNYLNEKYPEKTLKNANFFL